MHATNEKGLIPQETIDGAARLLLEAAPAGSEVILFGSYARGDARPDSDLDFMVVEPTVKAKRSESTRLRKALGSIRASIDVLVVSRQLFESWKQIPSNVIYWAAQEGRVYARRSLGNAPCKGC